MEPQATKGPPYARSGVDLTRSRLGQERSYWRARSREHERNTLDPKWGSSVAKGLVRSSTR
jgi:hypothetical protein